MTGSADTGFHFTGQYPTWYPQEKRRRRPNKGRIVVSDYKKGALQILEPKLREWWPNFPDAYRIKRDSGTGAIVRVDHSDGSFFDVMTFMQDPRLHEGVDLDWLWIDEPPPEDLFIANKRGLIDRDGICLMTFTLITEPWIIEKLFNPWLQGDSSIGFFFSSMDDNPYNSKESIEDFCKYLDPAELETRRFGRFGHLEGRILPIFSRGVHCIDLKGPEQIPKSWTRYFIIDPHDSRPHYMLWFAVSPAQPVSYAVCYRAWIKADLTIQQVVDQILREEARCGETIHRRIIDPNFGNKTSANTKTTTKQDFIKAGLRNPAPVDGFDDIALGHNRLKEWLWYDKTAPVDNVNCPKMYFASYLTEVIKAFLNYSWAKDVRGRPVLIGDAKPDPRYKDYIDCGRYFVMDSPRHVPAEQEAERRILPFARKGERHRFNLEG